MALKNAFWSPKAPLSSSYNGPGFSPQRFPKGQAYEIVRKTILRTILRISLEPAAWQMVDTSPLIMFIIALCSRYVYNHKY